MSLVLAVNDPVNYHGEIVPGASGTISVSITRAASSGELPFAAQLRVSATCTGCDYPESQIEFSWDFGDSAGTEEFTCPCTGQTLNANTAQQGHLGTYVYRTAGEYTVTVTARLWTGSTMLTGQATTTITVDAWSGSDMYFDSVGGSDSNDGLTDGAPKQTYAAIKSFVEGGSHRRALVKAGSTWTQTSVLTIPVTTGTQIVKYGTGANPVFTPNFSTTGVVARANGAVNSVVFSNISWDLDSVTSGINYAGVNAFAGLLLDNVSITDATIAGDGTGACAGATADTSSRVVLWNCTFTVDGSTNFVRHFWQIGDWFSAVGGTTGGGGTTPSHHFYLFRINYVYFWCYDFTAPTSDSALRLAIRYGCGDVAAIEGARNTSYLLFSRVYFRNHSVGLSLSGTNNGNHDDGLITKIVVQQCQFKMSNLGSGSFGIFRNNGSELTIRDSLFSYSLASNDYIYLADATLDEDLRFYRNRVYCTHSNGSACIGWGRTAGSSGLCEDNAFHLTGAGDVLHSFDTARIANFTFRRNRYYTPLVASPFEDPDGPSYHSLAYWQALTGTPDADAVTTSPGWLDPANLSFEAILGLANGGYVTALDGGTESIGTVAYGAAITRRLYNTGTEDISLTDGDVTGTGTTNVVLPTFATTLHPGDYCTVGWTATETGAAELSMTHGATGSPFTATETFTVVGGGGGAGGGNTVGRCHIGTASGILKLRVVAS